MEKIIKPENWKLYEMHACPYNYQYNCGALPKTCENCGIRNQYTSMGMNPISREDLEKIKVGSIVKTAPFGNEREVIEVRYEGINVNGDYYKGITCVFGDNAKITASAIEGEPTINLVHV